jgi:sporulation protein YtfJ
MHPIENIMKTSMEQIKEMVDVNTVIGTPIVLQDENMVLPVSKVCLGFFSGGGEYSGSIKSPVRKSGDEAKDSEGGKYPFAGASAAGMTLTPVAFLSVKDSCVKVLPVQNGSAWDRVIDMAFPLIQHIVSKKHKHNIDDVDDVDNESEMEIIIEQESDDRYEKREHAENSFRTPRYRRIKRR